MIEIATQDDLQDVTDLIMKRAEEFDFEKSGFPLPERDVVYDTVYRNYMLAPCYILKKNDVNIGCASTFLTTFGWSRQPYLTTFMVYVLPEYRNFAIVKSLYKKIQEYARLHGLLYVDGIVSIDRIDGKRRLMRAMGFEESCISVSYKGGVS